MIVYGYNTKSIGQGELRNVQCTQCQTPNPHVEVMGSYAHIFWIPLFPFRKKAVAVCPGCQKVYEKADIPADWTSRIDEVKSGTSFPFYMFSGLGIIAVALIIGFFANMSNESKVEEYVKAPQVEDVYVMIDPDEVEYKYYFAKVTEVREDTIYLAYSDYNYTQEPESMNAKDGFITEFTLPFAISQMEEYLGESRVVDVYRDYSASKGFSQTAEMDWGKLFEEMGLDSMDTGNDSLEMDLDEDIEESLSEEEIQE